MKKYEFTGEQKEITIDERVVVVKRIRALVDFRNVSKYSLGGWIESEDNLSHDDTCWVDDNAAVFDHAHVCDKAFVGADAMVYHQAKISEEATVYDYACVFGNACVFGLARVYGAVQLHGDIAVGDHVLLRCKGDFYGGSIQGKSIIDFGYWKLMLEENERRRKLHDCMKMFKENERDRSIMTV